MALTWEMVIETLPELVAVKLWLLVDPTWTFPKLTAAGLTLRTPKVIFVGLAAGLPEAVASALVEVFELGLALVTPTHPDKIATPSSTASKLSLHGFRLPHLVRRRQTHQ
jgi:hypothetical protein